MSALQILNPNVQDPVRAFADLWWQAVVEALAQMPVVTFNHAVWAAGVGLWALLVVHVLR